jgi:7-cyano-7-deazaguanine synthase in queuosine biosynthesis
MKTIPLINNIDLIIPDAPIGVMVSGGADSALLLYLILKNTKEHVHIFSLANQYKQSVNAKLTVDIISKCAELTENYNFSHHITYVKQQNKVNLFQVPTSYLDRGIIKFVYTGVTKNPPTEITDTFIESVGEVDERDPLVKRKTIHDKYNEYITPWTNIDKQDIHSMYVKFDLMYTVFPLTRSCEWTSQITEVADPGTNHCGICWWCEERKWGFGKL